MLMLFLKTWGTYSKFELTAKLALFFKYVTNQTIIFKLVKVLSFKLN